MSLNYFASVHITRVLENRNKLHAIREKLNYSTCIRLFLLVSYLSSRGSAVCVSHPPQTLVFHLSRRTGLLTAQGIGVLPRKRFVASVLGRRQREYLVTYVRQLAGGIKENFCSKVCFLRAVPWLDWKSIVDRGKVKVGASFLFFCFSLFFIFIFFYYYNARAPGPSRCGDRSRFFPMIFPPFVSLLSHAGKLQCSRNELVIFAHVQKRGRTGTTL